MKITEGLSIPMKDEQYPPKFDMILGQRLVKANIQDESGDTFVELEFENEVKLIINMTDCGYAQLSVPELIQKAWRDERWNRRVR